MHKRARSSKRSNEQTHPIHYQNKNIATDNGKHSHIKTKERNTKALQQKKRQQQPRNKNKNCRKKLMRNEISSTNERQKKTKATTKFAHEKLKEPI